MFDSLDPSPIGHIQHQHTYAHRRELHPEDASRRPRTRIITEREVGRHRDDDFGLVERIRDVE